MKHRIIILAMALVGLSATAAAQTVEADDFHHLSLRYKTPTPSVEAAEGGFFTLSLDGYGTDAAVGAPLLPVADALIAVPLGAEVEVAVSGAVFDTLPLPGPIAPKQPSRSKSDRTAHPLVVDSALYATDAFIGRPLAEARVLGMMRDRRLATLSFCPVRVNPVRGQMVVCRQAEVEVRFLHPDVDATLQHYRRYHTPAFATGETLNNLFSKTNASAVPVRMVVLVPEELRCHAIERFANWKRTQGLMTDVVYTSQIGGADTTAVSAYLQSLYDTASAAYPAPTYVLFVGDNDQLPARHSHMGDYTYNNGWYSETIELGDHITDLYHVTWDGDDVLPEAYAGRFSATDTTTLSAIVDKTLLYEQYAFEDDSYLGKAILVAGVDGGYSTDNAYRYCDPTMDYAARFYINASCGYNTVKYYKNRTNYAPTGVTVTGSSQTSATAATLRSLYSEGYGWINYSAHGDWNEWYQPGFAVSQVGSMNNYGKPSIMIGNCCLTNKFEKPTCFGEALLRRTGGAGAAAYIGGTAETYWEQDFVWSVGRRSNISGTMTPAYSASARGMYDRLFHTHGESLANQAITMGSMMYEGNMSVNGMSSYDEFDQLLITYYWEIYCLMGDPSLMPWLGTAQELTTFSVQADGTVQTVPYAYIALVGADLRVLSATYADASGNAVLDLSGIAPGCFFSVTAQGYKPFTQVADASLGIGGDVSTYQPINISLSPNPASGSCTVAAQGLRGIDILDATGRLLRSVVPTADRHTLALDGLRPGVYILRATTSAGTATTKLLVR